MLSTLFTVIPLRHDSFWDAVLSVSLYINRATRHRLSNKVFLRPGVSQDSKTTRCNATIAVEVSAAASPPMEKGNVTTLSAKCKERNPFKMDDCGWLPVMQLYVCVSC